MLDNAQNGELLTADQEAITKNIEHFTGKSVADFTAATDVSRPGSELKFLVLDAVIRAQAVGEKVGESLSIDKQRFWLLPAGKNTCF